MWLTSAQALAQYHRAYDNGAYQAVCRSVAQMLYLIGDVPLSSVRDLPEYIELTNLLTDAALEICGHPAYRGVSWTLAHRLHQISTNHAKPLATTAIEHLFEQVDQYLARYRQQMHQWQSELTPPTRTASQLEITLHLAEESVRSASEVAGWQGRTTYHLSAAGAGLLRVAFICLQANDSSSLHYATEKLMRAVEDIHAGLSELTAQSGSSAAFSRLYALLTRFLQEDK